MKCPENSTSVKLSEKSDIQTLIDRHKPRIPIFFITINIVYGTYVTQIVHLVWFVHTNAFLICGSVKIWHISWHTYPNQNFEMLI